MVGFTVGSFLQGQSGWGMKLTSHFCLVLRLRMCEAIPPWNGAWLRTGPTLPFTFLYP